jgi:hypothetical protein
MTAKTKAKTYSIEDFFTKTISEKGTKMPLLLDGEDTGCYLMVKGIESRSVQRARVVAQVRYAEAVESYEATTDKIEKELTTRQDKESTEIELALSLVVGWSFGEFSEALLNQLLAENQGLSIAVIAHATTPSNYLQKK